MQLNNIILLNFDAIERDDQGVCASCISTYTTAIVVISIITYSFVLIPAIEQ